SGRCVRSRTYTSGCAPEFPRNLLIPGAVPMAFDVRKPLVMLSSVRIAIRSLARRPAVALVAIVSLTVGIGINSAVFSVVDAVFLRPPAVSNPDNLVEIKGHFKDSGAAIIDWSDCREIAGQSSAFYAVTASMGRGGLWRNGDEMT